MEDERQPLIYVGPACHVQTADNRFGPNVLDDIKDWVHEEYSAPNGLDSDEDEDGEDYDDFMGSNGTDVGVDGLNYFQNPLIEEWPPAIQVDESNDGSMEHPNDHPSFPKVARVRSNLTCLSQQFNLYFAAYQDKIHVFQPQRAPQILPPPSLIIQPPRTRAAKVIGGILDHTFAHQMNHIITGELGNLEIVLACYDDGDVVAYYSHKIVDAIARNHQAHVGDKTPLGIRSALVKPFFHENVGMSAWGLAIHKKSRLFAVSCNKHDVTVFAFATKSAGNMAAAECGRSSDAPLSPKTWSGQTALELERHLQSRTRTWRIVLPLDREGNNIPSIAFIDDKDGNADKVAAVDVSGNTWILDIWKIGGFPALYPPTATRGAEPHRYTAWSILVLPDSSFKRTRNNRAAFGLPSKEIIFPARVLPENKNFNDVWLDTTCSLHYLTDNAYEARLWMRQRQGQRYMLNHVKGQALGSQDGNKDPTANLVDDDDEEDEDSDGESEVPPLGYQYWLEQDPNARWIPLSKDRGPEGASIDLAGELEQGFCLSRTIVPSLGQTPPVKTLDDFLSFVSCSTMREGLTHSIELRKVRLEDHLTANFSLLRTTMTDIELQSLDLRMPGVVCKDVLIPHFRPRVNHAQGQPGMPWDMNPLYSERISMSLHVPELGIAIVGSLCGRVAILALTKPPSRHQGARVRRAFRVQCILPRKAEDHARPRVALHGLAVSPVPDHRAVDARLTRPGRRPEAWRLILHYMDHTILMYDLAKRSPHEDLIIF